MDVLDLGLFRVGEPVLQEGQLLAVRGGICEAGVLFEAAHPFGVISRTVQGAERHEGVRREHGRKHAALLLLARDPDGNDETPYQKRELAAVHILNLKLLSKALWVL